MSWHNGISLVEDLWNQTYAAIPDSEKQEIARSWIEAAIDAGCDSEDLMGTRVGQTAGTISPEDKEDQNASTKWAWKLF